MRSRFIDSSAGPVYNGLLNTAEDEAFTNFFPTAARDGGSTPGAGAVAIPSTPALTGEAVQSLGAQSGPTTVVALTSGGITINLLFDAAAMAAPASFRAGIQQAASLLTGAISDKITVNIKIDYSGTGGGAAAGPDNGQYLTYSAVKSDLINNETPGDTTFSALPSGPSIQGQTNVAVWNAQLKLWGVLGANDTTTDDGSATFATDINSNLLVGVALHELTHAMGRVPYGQPSGPQPDIFDLFRFTAPGTMLIDGGNTAPAAYFSIDGGNTKLADFGRNSDPSDFLNSGVQGGNDPFNEFYTGSTIQSLTTVDKELMDALGFHTMAPVDHGPVVTAPNVTLAQNQSVAASSLFTAVDPDGDPITKYSLVDRNGVGSFNVNGVTQNSNFEIELTPAQLAQTTYHVGSGPDLLYVRAFDGTVWSDWQKFTVTAPAPVASAANATLAQNQSVAAFSPPNPQVVANAHLNGDGNHDALWDNVSHFVWQKMGSEESPLSQHPPSPSGENMGDHNRVSKEEIFFRGHEFGFDSHHMSGTQVVDVHDLSHIASHEWMIV